MTNTSYFVDKKIKWYKSTFGQAIKPLKLIVFENELFNSYDEKFK